MKIKKTTYVSQETISSFYFDGSKVAVLIINHVGIYRIIVIGLLIYLCIK